MTLGAYRYTPDKKGDHSRDTYFRGYVQWYTRHIINRKTCSEVRRTRAEALRDARKLSKLITPL